MGLNSTGGQQSDWLNRSWVDKWDISDEGEGII